MRFNYKSIGRNRTRMLALASATLLAVTGWSAASSFKASASAQSAVQGGTLRVLETSSPDGLDPNLQNETSALIPDELIYNTLVTYSPSIKPQPSLATSWTVSKNVTQFDFKLRRGVKFQNGAPFTSADVAYTLNRIRHTPTSPRYGDFQIIKAITTPSPYQVDVTLVRPDAAFLLSLANPIVSIESSKENPATQNTHPVGTGAFELQSWVQNESITLVRNPHYWQKGLPHLDKMVFTFNSTPSAEVAAISSGTVNFLIGAPLTLIGQLKSNPNLSVYTGPGALGWNYFQVNVEKTPFNNINVRHAMWYALNDNEIVQTCLPGGVGVPLNDGGFIPPGSFAAPTKPIFTQNIAKAKSLLKESGHASGLSFTIGVLNASSYSSCIAQVVQSQLEKIGIKTTLNLLTVTNYVQEDSAMKYQALVGGWTGDASDPSERLESSFVTNAGDLWTHVADPKLDSLTEQAESTTNSAEQARLYAEAQQEIEQKGADYYLAATKNYNVAAKNVHGYVYTPSYAFWNLENVWIGN